MEALEVGDLRGVARLHQGVEAGLDQFGDAAAEHRLLAEQVGFGLFPEGGLEDAGPGAADAFGIGQGGLPGLTRGVLLHGDQAGNADALLVFGPHQVAGTLGRHHDDVDFGAGTIWPKWMLKPWENSSVLPLVMWGFRSFS